MIAIRLFVSALLFVGGHSFSRAAIAFTASGTGIQTFDALPTPSNGWSKMTIGSGNGTYTTSSAIDLVAQTMAASDITNELITTSVVPPSVSAQGPKWNSALRCIQSRPAGVAADVVMATLRNDGDHDVGVLAVSYRYAAIVSSGSTIVESVPGHRVFYSTTGQPSSWILVPELSNAPQGTFTNALSARIEIFGGWYPGALLYFIWIDDDGPFGDSPPTREGGYTIDDFLVISPLKLNITFPDQDTIEFTWDDPHSPFCIQWKQEIDATWVELVCPGTAYLQPDGKYHVSMSKAALRTPCFFRLARKGA